MPLEGLHLGHYRLLRLLGSGGMGEVYLAEDARIGQQVAIKVIRAEGITYPGSESAKEAARLFEREAKAIARLDHPNILPLYAYGEETLNETLLTYMVMPYRKEGTLANWLRQRDGAAPLSPIEVVALLQQAADALQHAHDQQVLHQDIKPSNFLIRLRHDHPDHPDLLLSDFGIAKLTSATASASQSIRGTPIYMAPEQWDGHPVAASDQYALAIMVYELLVGRPPFVGNPGQVMRQHYMTPPPAPSTLGGHLSPAIDAVLLRALSKQPDERFPSVAAFARAFQEALESEGELHATLAISRAEAESGATRTLTLPGGRQVSVSVPAGVGDGTTLRLEGQGMPYYAGGPAGPLVLTLAIPTEASQEPLPQDSTDPTLAVSLPIAEPPAVEDTSKQPAHPEAPGDRGELEPTVPAPHVSATASTVLATDAISLPTEADTPALPESKKPLISTSTKTTPSLSTVATMPSNTTPFRPSSRRFSVGWMFLILLALLLIVGGGGAIYYYAATQNQVTITANLNLTATALANNYLTATANGLATSQANGYATATAQANATSTALAIAPKLQINESHIAAAAVSSNAYCSYLSNLNYIYGGTYPGWSCPLTLINTGSSNLSWTYSNGTASTTGSGGARAILKPASGLGINVIPSSGTISPQQTEQVSAIVYGDLSTCQAFNITNPIIFTFNGPANSVKVSWFCQ
jgi:serine/threonine protein kinase